MTKHSTNWKTSRLKEMREIAGVISEKRSQNNDVSAVLLFGSVATGEIHPESDIDIVIIKNQEESLIRREQPFIRAIEVDLWEHSAIYYERLFRQDWKPSEMFLYSLFLNILQNSEILHEKGSKFSGYRKRALKWEWSKECKDYIRDRLEYAVKGLRGKKLTELERSIYQKKIVLLETCRTLLDYGKPVSNRNKDLYLKSIELSTSGKFEKAFGPSHSVQLEELVKTGMSFFNSEFPNREPITELNDARKHLENGEYFLSSISLQNGSYYVGSTGLVNRCVVCEEKGFLNPESEVELIQVSKKMWVEFFDYYREAHLHAY